jgi:uncharacterized membrane protein YoaK (UPF0700 family)
VANAASPSRQALPTVLSLNAGYVDTAGFLAFKGLFTAHVTGNFVTLGATFVLGTSGAIAKLLALPVFCVAVVLTRLFARRMPPEGPVLRFMLIAQIVLLFASAAAALWLGPFADADAWSAVLVGLTLVTAMAIQNAAHRLYLPSAPPTTLMTGTTTQIMIDLVDIFYAEHPDASTEARARLRRMAATVAAFALGCAAATTLFWLADVRSFLAAPLFALWAFYLLRPEATRG